MKKRCNPCDIDAGNIKLYYRNSESLIYRQEEKKKQAKVKITSYLTGEVKINFVNHCQLQGLTESEMLRQIVKTYYNIVKKMPELKGKSLEEANALIINNL